MTVIIQNEINFFGVMNIEDSVNTKTPLYAATQVRLDSS